MSAYTTLAADIATYTHRTDLTAAQISTFVRLAEATINRRLRVRQMETALAATAIDSSNAITLPTGWLATKTLWPDGYEQSPLLPHSVEYVVAQDWQSGVPSFYAVKSGSWFFDGAGSVAGVYYTAVPGLESSGDNWLSALAPDLYLFGALGEACIYTQDEKQMALYTLRFDAAVSEIHAADQRDRFSGPLRSAKR